MTHSTAVLDYVKTPSEVVLLSLENGETKARRLGEEVKERLKKSGLTLSELIESAPTPDMCYVGPMPQLPKPVEARLRDVLGRFGAWGRERLARHISRLLWLNPWKEYEYGGADLHEYVLDQGFRVVHVEKCRRR